MRLSGTLWWGKNAISCCSPAGEVDSNVSMALALKKIKIKSLKCKALTLTTFSCSVLPFLFPNLVSHMSHLYPGRHADH